MKGDFTKTLRLRQTRDTIRGMIGSRRNHIRSSTASTAHFTKALVVQKDDNRRKINEEISCNTQGEIV